MRDNNGHGGVTMNKELFLTLVGMSEEQVLSEAAKINLNTQEIESFHNGKDFKCKWI